MHETPDSTTSTSPIAARMLPVLTRAIRRHRRITITLVDNIDTMAANAGLPPLPDGYSGLTDKDSGDVYLDADSDDHELRATIAHELEHLADPDATEEEVELRTAELLIPIHVAMHAHTTGNHAAAADRCHVDMALVRTRIRGLLDTPTVRIPAPRGGPDLHAVAG